MKRKLAVLEAWWKSTAKDEEVFSDIPAKEAQVFQEWRIVKEGDAACVFLLDVVFFPFQFARFTAYLMCMGLCMLFNKPNFEQTSKTSTFLGKGGNHHDLYIRIEVIDITMGRESNIQKASTQLKGATVVS